MGGIKKEKDSIGNTVKYFLPYYHPFIWKRVYPRWEDNGETDAKIIGTRYSGLLRIKKKSMYNAVNLK